MSQSDAWFCVAGGLIVIVLVFWFAASGRPQVDVPSDSISSTQIDEHGVKCYYRASASPTNLSCVKVR